MTRDELLQAYAEGRRDFGRVYLGGAYLEGANLEGANLGGAYLGGAYLGGAYLEGANLEGAYLGGAYLGRAYLGGGTRWHKAGVWTQSPPRCEAGDWWAICPAPGIVRIGCTTLPLDEWLGEAGERLADENDVSPMDQHVLRCWAEMLADLGDDLPGWKPDPVESEAG